MRYFPPGYVEQEIIFTQKEELDFLGNSKDEQSRTALLNKREEFRALWNSTHEKQFNEVTALPQTAAELSRKLDDLTVLVTEVKKEHTNFLASRNKRTKTEIRALMLGVLVLELFFVFSVVVLYFR